MEFPYVPATTGRHFRRPSTTTSDTTPSVFQIDSVKGTCSQHLSNQSLDVDVSSDISELDGTLGTGVASPDRSVIQCIQRQRLNMWDPDTNGTMFRNGSITVAINGININAPSWADPEVIPPWAFKDRAEYERVNPLFPVPGFDNDKVLVPFPTAYEVNFDPPSEPLSMPISDVAKATLSKRRKNKRTPSDHTDLETLSSKKPRTLISPGFRLSNSHGGRRGGRGGTRGRGRGRGKSTDVSLESNHSVVGNKPPATITIDCNSVPHDELGDSLDSSTYSVSTGMEDLTHLRGCGGWPNSAARDQ